jgi:hypothetical protein
MKIHLFRVVRQYATLMGGSSGEKIKKILLFALSTAQWSIQDMVGISQKLFFFQLCYLISVEYEKCFEMCV